MKRRRIWRRRPNRGEFAFRSREKRALCTAIPKIFCGAQGFLVWNFESGILDAADRPRCVIPAQAGFHRTATGSRLRGDDVRGDQIVQTRLRSVGAGVLAEQGRA